jgi:hypothetical protein
LAEGVHEPDAAEARDACDLEADACGGAACGGGLGLGLGPDLGEPGPIALVEGAGADGLERPCALEFVEAVEALVADQPVDELAARAAETLVLGAGPEGSAAMGAGCVAICGLIHHPPIGAGVGRVKGANVDGVRKSVSGPLLAAREGVRFGAFLMGQSREGREGIAGEAHQLGGASAVRVGKDLPVLDHVASGRQCHVYGLGDWVIKVRRRGSLLGLLSGYLVRGAWRLRVEQELGGLVLPFRRLGPVTFLASEAGGARSGRKRRQRVGEALAFPRVGGGDFLDQVVSCGGAGEVAAAIDAQLTLLEGLAERGFYMIDFIMANFVWWGGRLWVSDHGLIVPSEALRYPSPRVTASWFRKKMKADYLRVLGEVLERCEGERWAGDLAAVVADFEGRIEAVAARAFEPGERAGRCQVAFPPELEEQIREVFPGVL